MSSRIKGLTAFALLAVLGFAAGAQAQPLTLVEVESAGPLAGLRTVVLAPGDGVAVVCSHNDHSVTSYTRDTLIGVLDLADAAVDGSNGVDGLRQAQDCAVSPDGQNVYVASRMDDAISVFSLDDVTGDLGFVQAALNETAGIEGLWQNASVAVTPDGAYVLGSGRRSPAQPRGALALFTRDAITGAITFADNIVNIDEPAVTELGNGGQIFVSPDGAFVHVLASDAISIFSIDTTNDLLVFEGVVENGVAGVSGIGGSNAMAFTADGTQAFVTGATDNALAVFTRNPTTGELTFETSFTDGVGGVDGLNGASAVVINPAGNRVYAAGAQDNAVAIFVRAANGDMLFVAVARDGVNGLDSLGGVNGLAISADDEFLYASAGGEDTVGVFRRGNVIVSGDVFDFGDAPDPTFPTLLASNGAVHAITDGALRLGAALDADIDGQPDAGAAGDDGAVVDDEDGVAFVEALNPGQDADIEVTASAAGLLDAWIDWNADGDWSDGGERIATALAVSAGVNTLTVSVPAFAPADNPVFARFRLSTAGVASFDGSAADGEVEDHLVAIGRAADLAAAGDDTISDWTDPYSMEVTISNAGPSSVTGATVTVTMSANSGAVTWTCLASNGSCTGAGVGDVADSVDLGVGGTAVYTISGTVPDGDPGPYITATASVAVPIGTFDPSALNDSGQASVLISSIFRDAFESSDTSAWTNDFP